MIHLKINEELLSTLGEVFLWEAHSELASLYHSSLREETDCPNAKHTSAKETRCHEPGSSPAEHLYMELMQIQGDVWVWHLVGAQ